LIETILRIQACTEELLLQRPEEKFKAAICLCYVPDIMQYHEIVKLLHPQERKYYDSLKFEKRRKSYFIGRFAAKHAVSSLAGERDFQAILIRQGIFSQPIVTYIHEQNLQVSISHCEDLGAALAFPEAHPLGIDIEKIDTDRCSVLESQMTRSEKEQIKDILCSYDRMLTVLWTVKEALSKILRTGLTTPFHIFEVDRIEAKTDHLVAFFKNFEQYKAVSFDVGFSVCSIVYPKKTVITLDIPLLKRAFNFAAEKNQEREKI
jgi:phosphopantetheinyl transferase